MKQILKKINELNETQKVETKGKRLIKSQEKLLSFFDDLTKIFNNNNDNIKIVNKIITQFKMKIITKL